MKKMKSVDIYYDCLDKQNYITVKITRLFNGGKLSISNGIYITEKCRKTGLLVAQGQLYGYVVFKYGYLIFGGCQRQTHFGYSLFKSNVKKSNTIVSTFCTYLHFNEQNLKEKIYTLKYGQYNNHTKSIKTFLSDMYNSLAIHYLIHFLNNPELDSKPKVDIDEYLNNNPDPFSKQSSKCINKNQD